MILKCLYSDTVNPDFLHLDGRYRAGFVEPLALRDFVGRADYELPSHVVESAIAAGDACFAIHDGGTLAAYQWYSTLAHAFDDTVDVHWRSGHVYMHHAFTHRRYRGRRLNAFSATLALRHYLRQGYEGVACCVEHDNQTSLKSFARIGFRQVGTIVVFKLGRLVGLRRSRHPLLERFVVYVSPGCKALGFRFVTKPRVVRVMVDG